MEQKGQWDGEERRGKDAPIPFSDRRADYFKRFAEAVALQLKEKAHTIAGLTEEDHMEHHTIFKQWIERENTKAERIEKMKQSALGWFVVTVLGTIGKFAYDTAQIVLQHKK